MADEDVKPSCFLAFQVLRYIVYSYFPRAQYFAEVPKCISPVPIRYLGTEVLYKRNKEAEATWAH